MSETPSPPTPEQDIVEKPGRTLASHTTILAIGNLANRGLSIFLLPLYLNEFSPAQYGLIELAIPAGQILQRIVGQGMGTALFRAFSFQTHEDVDRTDLIATALRYAVVSTVVMFAVSAAAAPWVSDWVYKDFPGTLFILLAFGYGCLRNISTLGQQILRARLKTYSLIVLNSAEFLTNLGFNLLFILAWGFGPIGVLYSHLIGGAVGVVLTLAMVPEVFRGTFQRHVLPGMLRFGLPMVPGGIALYLMNYIDRWFLEHWTSGEDVGLYGVAAKFANGLEVALLSPFAMVWPAIYFRLAKEKEGAPRLGQLWVSVFSIGLAGALGIAFFVPAVIELLAPDPEKTEFLVNRDYGEAGSIVGLLALAVVASLGRELVKISVNISGKSKYLPLINILGIGYCVLFNWLLIPPYGMVGAALGTVLAFVAVDATLYAFGRVLYPVPVPAGKLAIVATAFAALFAWAHFTWDQIGLMDLLQRAVAFLGFAALLLWTGVIDRELLQRLKRRGGGARRSRD